MSDWIESFLRSLYESNSGLVSLFPVSFTTTPSSIFSSLSQIVSEYKPLHSALPFLLPIGITLHRFALQSIDLIFGFKRITHQIALIACLQASIGLGRLVSTHLFLFLHSFTKYGKLRKQIREQMNSADSYTAWHSLAEELDRLTGKDKWRKDDQSSLFDSHVLKKRIDDIRAFIKEGDVFTLLFRLRGGVSRDQFGIQHEALHSTAAAGPKLIVEEYHATVCEALHFVANTEDANVPTDAKLAFFNETRHAYGRTALLLSGGAYLGYYHVGLCISLLHQGLLPRVISGASAGSLITAIIGTKLDSEFLELARSASFRMDHFSFGWQKRIRSPDSGYMLQYFFPQSLRWLSDTLMDLMCMEERHSLLKLDTEHLKQVVIENIGHYTFQEAFDRTGRIINITVAPMNNYDPPRLLNYLTAPHVCVWSAAVASCAIPGVFEPMALVVKEPSGKFAFENEWTLIKGPSGALQQPTAQALAEMHAKRDAQRFSDGSVESDLPMQQLSEQFNINHFIVSQVNPHSFIFAKMSEQASTIGISPVFDLATGCLHFLKAIVREWFRQFINLVTYGTNLPVWSGKRGIAQALTQEYQGRDIDITIMPWAKHISVWRAFFSVIKNPTIAEFKDVVKASYKSSFPYLSRIRAHCSVEIALDRCVQQLRRKIADEEATDIGSVHTPSMFDIIPSQAVPNSGSQSTMPQGDAEAPRSSSDTSEPSQRRGRMRGRDRTPSFYTSRSLLNLSGLSVSDPHTISVANNNGSQLRNTHRGSFYSTGLVVEPEDPRATSLPKRTSRDTMSPFDTNSTLSGSNIHPLSQNNSRVNSTDNLFGAVPAQDISLNSEYPMTSPIKKSTSMARFYYQNNTEV